MARPKKFKVYYRGRKTKRHGTSCFAIIRYRSSRPGEPDEETVHLGYNLKRREIDDRLSKIEAELYNNTWGNQEPSEVMLPQLIKTYLSQLDPYSYSSKTIQSYEIALKLLVRKFSKYKVREVTKPDLEQFLNHLKSIRDDKPLAPRSKNIILTNIRLFFD